MPTLSPSLRYRHWRHLKDRIARRGVAFGGVSVIIAILLIFFYLLTVVVPLFEPAEVKPRSSFLLSETPEAVRYLTLDEYREIGLAVDADGTARFFRLDDGGDVTRIPLELPPGARVTSLGKADPAVELIALGLDNGQALVIKPVYKISYPNDRRHITPQIEYPLGQDPIEMDEDGGALRAIAIQMDEERATLAAVGEDGRLFIAALAIEESFLDDGFSYEQENTVIDPEIPQAHFVLVSGPQTELYLAGTDGDTLLYSLHDPTAPELIQRLDLTPGGERLTSLRFLTGSVSLMAGDSHGQVAQWFPVNDQGRPRLVKVRQFTNQTAPIGDIAPEHSRRGFIAGDDQGRLGIYYTTSERLLSLEKISDAPLLQVAVSPRADAALALDAKGRLHVLDIRNEHPEISFKALWGAVWYEGYSEPAYLWQSTAATADFEPKFSLTPLALGTLKAAFYAMVIAVPLAIMGAIYTAYFMTPALRRVVKPTIEIMEALPTVILGFLAGLWLAPYVESHLPGIFALLLVLPAGVLLFAYLWHQLPDALRRRIPEGWEPVLLIPVIVVLVSLSMWLSYPLEQALFDGDMRNWLANDLGIPFDQRNAIVVGLAMGFAVIPTIFSITEDAIFQVPKHLTFGSLALGATPWQTLTRVVILTASPGIFSAVMIGLGRAVGETMIVLMATGNTPVMDWSIFQGMRTLSANIAVEMPESEVGSTHYRVLFLAALVLFLFTFLVNTLAEVVRQRLRRKYSSL